MRAAACALLLLAEQCEAATCADYGGITHANWHDDSICCAAACGDYCGDEHCNSGPGGGDACCKSHITSEGRTCSASVRAPCVIATGPPPAPTPAPPATPAPPPPAGGIYDDFASRDSSTWIWDNKKYVSQFAPGYYLENHTEVGAALSLGEGKGLVVTMSSTPCKYDASANCHGADMASGHVQTKQEHSYGDYEARFRAPHVPGGTTCPDGIYGYFTAGYSKHDGVQNEMNFGFHPDRDHGGTQVSCESHADTGSYRETSEDLGFNYRAAFHTYLLRLRPDYVEWFVDGKSVHKVTEKLTHTMHTSFILRTNKEGTMDTVIMEWAYFRFTPYSAAGNWTTAR